MKNISIKKTSTISQNSNVSSQLNKSSLNRNKNTQSSITSIGKKVSFFHREYLLPFKLTITSLPLAPSSINYSKLQLNIKQLIEKQLIFSTSQQKSLISNLSIQYCQSFISLYEYEKQRRKQIDWLGSTYKQHLIFFLQDKSQQTNIYNHVLNLISPYNNSKPSLSSIKQIIQTYLFNKNIKTICLKSQLIIYQYLHRNIFMTKQQQSLNIQVYLGYILLILKCGYFFVKQIYHVNQQLHQIFLSNFVNCQIVQLFLNIFIQNIKKMQVTITQTIIIELVFCFIQDYIKSQIFIWTNLQYFQFINLNHSKTQSNIDGQKNVAFYKASVLNKCILIINQLIQLKKINIQRKQQYKQSNQSQQSAIMWLMTDNNSENKQSKFKQNLQELLKMNQDGSGNQWNTKISQHLSKFEQKSMLNNLINETCQKVDKKASNTRQRPQNFMQCHINKNLNIIYQLCRLIHNILQNHIKSQQTPAKLHIKSHTNELLLFVTETIRYQFPQNIKLIQQKIKERKYKIYDSIIVQKIFTQIQTSIIHQVYSQLENSQLNNKFNLKIKQDSTEFNLAIKQDSNVFNPSILNNSSLLNSSSILNITFQQRFQYFKLKQMIRLVKPSQDSFFYVSKKLFKQLKILKQKYHQFKSGRIIVEKKIKSQNQSLPQHLKQNFIKKIRQKKQSDSTQNFYQVYYFDYSKYGINVNKTDIGINVNLSTQQSNKNINNHDNKVNDNKFLHTNDNQRQQALKKIRKQSQSLQQNHKLLNQNHQIYKSKDQTNIKIFKQNQQLIKVNTWYQQQLRIRQDKQIKLEGVISQLVTFNQIKQSKLEKRRKQLTIDQGTIEIKVQPHKNNKDISKDKNIQKLEQLLISRNSNHSHNRTSRDSHDKSGTRQRKASHAHLRLINDLNKLSIPQQKPQNIFILPPPPPFQGKIIPSNNLSDLLPPPPPLLSLIVPQLSEMPLPPPPPPLLLHSDLSKVDQISQNDEVPDAYSKIQMKNIGWNMIDVTKIPQSFWQSVQQVQFSCQQLVNNFSKTAILIQPSIILQKQKQLQKKSLLRPDRIKNIQIGLRKTRLNYKNMNNLQQILYKYNQNYFDQEIIDCILSLIPNQKEKDDFSELTILDQYKMQWTLADYFFANITKVQSYQQRLKAISFKYSFPEISDQLLLRINAFIQYFDQLRHDIFLQSFLQNLLTIGNFLNRKTNKANAYGFRLDSISKTYTLIGQDHKTSLFDYILKQMLQKDEQQFKLVKDTSLSTTSSLITIQQQFKNLSMQCQNLQQIIIYSRKSQDNSSPYLLPFYISTQQKLNLIKKLISLAKEKFEQFLAYYCQKMDSENTINFINQFRKRVRQFYLYQKRRKANDQQKSRMSMVSMRYSTISQINHNDQY